MKGAFVFIMIVAGIALVELGCTHTESLTRETLSIDTDRDIVVHTKDGRAIKFAGGDYRIVETNSGSLKGKGRIIAGEWSEVSKIFDGELTFQEIQDIQHSELTTGGKISTVVVLASIAGGVLLLIALTQVKWD